MKIAIIGSGGAGGYFGAKLAKTGNEVAFLARGEHLYAIRHDGLQVRSYQGDFRIYPVKVTDQIKELGASDLIILGVKAWQIKQVAKDLPHIMHENSIIMPLQNGVMTADELKEHINPTNIIGGLCRIFSKIESPGIISHLGVDPLVIFGELDDSVTKRIQRIKELFDRSGINSKIAYDIHAELWKKFISICAGGLLAITRSSYGELRELAPTRNMMIDLLQEIYLLSQKLKIGIEPDFMDKAVAFIDMFPYDASSSLARDIWEGKPSEIEYQNGAVVRMGEQFGVDTPINRFVYYSILPMEIRARNSGK